MNRWLRLAAMLALLALLMTAFAIPASRASEADDDDDTSADLPKVANDIAGDRVGSKTDDQVVEREEQAIHIDGLSVSEVKQLRERSDKFAFQTEVNRMMKLIINSLYKNKDIFLRELISNASDALDKIRFLSVSDPKLLGETTQLRIQIFADAANKVLHITDTGVGMTRDDLIRNLGTIAKSGTAEFLHQMQESQTADASSLIGQFGVGFYSAFLVADTVVVTTKHNDDKQYIWESDASSFSIVEDPRGNTLGRGSTISLHLKEEAHDFLDQETVRNLIRKYSEFINYPIYLFVSTEAEVTPPAMGHGSSSEEEAADTETETSEDADVQEEPAAAAEKPNGDGTSDWELLNANKPIWTRAAKDIADDEYVRFYKGFSKDEKDPLTHIHFSAEGDVSFRSILFIPSEAPQNMLTDFHKKVNNIKMYVRRVFITDEFDEMLPRYLSFISGVVDSDDLPLNVSRETLQQHKLLKVIKKKLVRKALEMIKKLAEDDEDKEKYKTFWKAYGTNIKLGLIDDFANRSRLAKLLRFPSSNSDTDDTSLTDYLARMKEGQSNIFFMAGLNREETSTSPFVERLLKRGYEVLYLVDPVDEYTIQNLPEFEGKKFQNVAKEGLKFGDETDSQERRFKKIEKQFKPLTDWLRTKLEKFLDKAVISTRLTGSPCALVASSYGWSGNMERIMKAQAYSIQNDPTTAFYAAQKKTLELNPGHPLVRELLNRVKDEPESVETLDLATLLYETSVLRSGYSLKDSADFATRIERILRLSMDVDPEAKVDAIFDDEDAFADEEEEEVEEVETFGEEDHVGEDEIPAEEHRDEL
ncbi:glucose-regulated protein 94 [Capsaspora owczarzaki ATCC 30864]|uniref:Glucose-regulated protein 94 n=1 Tax=Capsaspora owczarzaki (strain ATCC 30864) TaxID=595528 RepID=A0A0D2WM74_CAPO3|nr:glucose-regulated protein 94 [Capsaspora owczarzaki ATCC 30864]KJE91193.1 glucose-regulated protein 94 [Capsaspora owczarzaki ATCC 30864]|eukprot:XP_004349108.2 glucose-regulated protein 94 [Capsaspora owczarzaki ATCC 30864]